MKAFRKVPVKIIRNIALMAISLMVYRAANAATEVNVVGLFSNKAVLVINGGKPKTLTVGESSNGVKLIAADSSIATLMIEGRLRQVGMGQAASIGGDASKGVESVTLYANPDGHFVSDCVINGASFKFLLDTGATTVAMNSGDAQFAHIDYKRGIPTEVTTANGVVTAYRITLASIKIAIGLWPVHLLFLSITIYMFYRRVHQLPALPELPSLSWLKASNKR